MQKSCSGAMPTIFEEWQGLKGQIAEDEVWEGMGGGSWIRYSIEGYYIDLDLSLSARGAIGGFLTEE